MATNSQLIGSAGEHFIMSALLRQGLVAALAPEGAPNLDILVSDIGGNQLCGLQVKSRSGRGSDGGWHMRPKHENMSSRRLFYCFVNFADAGEALHIAPEVFVVPSKVVSTALSSTHEIWLRNPGKNGHVRKPNNVRRLLPDYTRICSPEKTEFGPGWLDQYKYAWHLIKAKVPASDYIVDGGKTEL